MKVLAFHLTHPAGSEARVLSQLLRHLDDDIDVDLVLNPRGLARPDSCFAALSRRVNLRAADTGLPLDPQSPRPLAARLRSRVRYWLSKARVMRLAAELRPDCIYTSQQRFDCDLGTESALRLGIPHIVHLHYTPGPWLGGKVLRRLRTCERVVAVSRFIARLAEEHGVEASRIAVLPNTIEVPEQQASPARGSRPFRVGQTGRMVPVKGFEDAVRAFARLRQVVPGAELVLVGDGSERPRLEKLVAELGLREAVRFPGWQSDVRSWLGTFEVFIHPSRFEPFGLAVLEASAAGVPVVGYDDGGVGEIVVHGQTGLLVAPGDVQGLADGLVRLCQDSALREAMGRAGRSRAATAFVPAEAGRLFSSLLRGSAAVKHRP